jgi:ureidoacrylate peracid hydrolase
METMHNFSFPDKIVERLKARRGRLHVYEDLNPRRAALVVIDMQNAFLAPGAPTEIPVARDIVPNINRIAASLRTAGGTIVWVQMTLNAISDWPVFLEHVLGPDQAEALVASLKDGSKGHRLWEALDVRNEDLVVKKNRFSAFLHTASPLMDQLRERGIDTVIIVGTLTSVCSESSARDAIMQDFKTIMVTDANATRTDEEHAAAMIAFITSFGDVRTAQETIELIERGAVPAGFQRRAPVQVRRLG